LKLENAIFRFQRVDPVRQTLDRRLLKAGSDGMLLDDPGEFVSIGCMPVALRGEMPVLFLQPVNRLPVQITLERGSVEHGSGCRESIVKNTLQLLDVPTQLSVVIMRGER
jgi:hypothetical protein